MFLTIPLLQSRYEGWEARAGADGEKPMTSQENRAGERMELTELTRG